MNKKEISVFFTSVVLIMVLITIGFVGLNLIGCGSDEVETGEGIKKLTGEEQKDIARFVEYVFFPTSPYIDKSWVETGVPEDEVAEKLIDFPTETAAIQQIYTQVYSAWNANDFESCRILLLSLYYQIRLSMPRQGPNCYSVIEQILAKKSPYRVQYRGF